MLFVRERELSIVICCLLGSCLVLQGRFVSKRFILPQVLTIDCHYSRFIVYSQEIDSNAKFEVSGTSRFDVVQGELGDCWCVSLNIICTVQCTFHVHCIHTALSLIQNVIRSL